MFKKLTPLKYSVHANLRLRPITDYGFARSELIAPIVIDEIADVAREYPIVFPKGGKLPVVLMGVNKDNNAYVGVDGQWLATYIPAHIRHYPLALANVSDQAAKGKVDAKNESRLLVLVDEESAVLSEGEGQPLFTRDGKLAHASQQLVGLMEQVQNRVGITQLMVQAINEAGLLMERSIRIKHEGEAERNVEGVCLIDEDALNKLDDLAFNKLRKSGALPLVYASLLSWANLRHGPIGKPQLVPELAVEDEVIRFN